MKYNYQPDIDELRAISVLLVLFFHAGIFGIKAGFIGVDIFFVISGFLITIGIKNGLESDNFSFIQFKKKIMAITASFHTLLLVTTIFAAFSYLPEDFLKFTDSAKWAARFQANRYFAGLDAGYFADDTSIMPLLQHGL